MRPIDADAMRQDWLENGENEHVYDTNAFLDSIDDQPTLEVEHVVRCKDCRHRGDGDVCPMRHIVWSEEEGYYFIDVTMDDYYCSFGERRESNAGN